MTKYLSSPLLRTLMIMAGVAVLAFGVPYLIPLPGTATRSLSTDGEGKKESTVIISSIDYSEAIERPLFHTNRKKAVKEVIVEAPVVEKRVEAPFKLVGIMGGANNSRSAYLQHTDSGETTMVRVKDTADGWYVDTIGQDFVALTYEGERRVIQLAGGG